MTEAAVRVDVDVGVNPEAAFRIFTEEIDLWWVRGPANFYDGARAQGMRFEPGVGGRFLQVNVAAEDRVLGRVTAWQPGALLAYETVDGAVVEIRFQATPGGARVIVEQRGPGMSAWTNILGWFRHRADDGYCAAEMPRVTPVLFYLDVPAAAEWLVAAFGFWGRGGFGVEYAHLTRAREAGATIVEDVHRRGDTAYVAHDPEGHRWTFAQARASMRIPRR